MVVFPLTTQELAPDPSDTTVLALSKETDWYTLEAEAYRDQRPLQSSQLTVHFGSFKDAHEMPSARITVVDGGSTVVDVAVGTEVITRGWPSQSV